MDGTASSEVLALVDDLPSLVRVLVQRRKALGLSQMAVDDISGLQGGYVAKIEVGMKNLGPLSLPCMLGALGLKLAVVPVAGTQSESDDETNTSRLRLKKVRKSLATLGGKARAAKMTKEERRASARHAAKSRWRDWRAMKAEKDRKAKRGES